MVWILTEPRRKQNYRAIFNEYNAVSNEADVLITPYSDAVGDAFKAICELGFDPRDVANLLIAEIGVHASEAVLRNAMQLRELQ